MSSAASLSEAKRKLMESYLRGRSAPAQAAESIGPRPPGIPVPMSLSQEQLVLRETTVPDVQPLYNECVNLRMRGPLDVSVLERSLAAIIQRHEIWRTTYTLSGGRFQQLVHPAPEEVSLEVVDLSSKPAARQEPEVQGLIGEIVRQPFDLERGPLLRHRLVKLGESEHRLFLVAHLSIVDGVSAYQVWPTELAALYRAFLSGLDSPLPNLSTQDGDYAYWQRSRLKRDSFAQSIAYWRQQLAGPLPVFSWPSDSPKLDGPAFNGTIESFALPSRLSVALKELSKREGVTLFMTLLAGFVCLFFARTQQEDLIIGTPSPAGRKRSEVKGLLGYFLNPVALRFELRGNPSFREFLRQAQRVTLEAISHDDVPLEILAQELQGTSDLRRNPFFKVAMSLQPPMPEVGLPWSVTSMDVASGGSPWDLYIAFIDQPEGIAGRVQYNPDLFDAQTISETWEHLQGLLQQFSACPQMRLSEAVHITKDATSA